MQGAAQSLVRRARAGDQNAIGMLICVRKAARKSKRAALACQMAKDYAKKTKPVIDTEGFEIGIDKPNYSRELVKYANSNVYSGLITVLPKAASNIDESIKAAFLIADGKDVTDELISKIVQYCKGDIAFTESGKPIIGGVAAAEKAKREIAKEFTFTREGRKLKVKPSGSNVYVTGFTLTYKDKPTAVPCHDILAAGYNAALYTDKVIDWANGMPGNAKRILQLGYTLGLANKIQGITRRNAKIGSLSSMVAWELGE